MMRKALSPLTHVALVFFPAKTSCEVVLSYTGRVARAFRFSSHEKKKPTFKWSHGLKTEDDNRLHFLRENRQTLQGQYKVGSQVESYTQNQYNLKQRVGRQGIGLQMLKTLSAA